MAQHNKERRYTVIVVTTTATLPKHAAPFCSLQIMFCILTVRYIYYISQCNSRVYNLVNNTTPIELTSQMSHYNRRNWIILNVEASLAAPPKCQGPQLVLGWDEGESVCGQWHFNTSHVRGRNQAAASGWGLTLASLSSSLGGSFYQHSVWLLIGSLAPSSSPCHLPLQTLTLIQFASTEISMLAAAGSSEFKYSGSKTILTK